MAGAPEVNVDDRVFVEGPGGNRAGPDTEGGRAGNPVRVSGFMVTVSSHVTVPHGDDGGFRRIGDAIVDALASGFDSDNPGLQYALLGLDWAECMRRGTTLEDINIGPTTVELAPRQRIPHVHTNVIVHHRTRLNYFHVKTCIQEYMRLALRDVAPRATVHVALMNTRTMNYTLGAKSH